MKLEMAFKYPYNNNNNDDNNNWIVSNNIKL